MMKGDEVCANCGMSKKWHKVTFGLNRGNAVLAIGPCIDGPKEWNKNEIEVVTMCHHFKGSGITKHQEPLTAEEIAEVIFFLFFMAFLIFFPLIFAFAPR